MNSIICDAIRAKRLIRFVYEGYERIVEPHIHGINSANHEMLSGWLVGGWSESKPEQGWRNYLVKDMHDVHALADGFERPRSRYNAFDRNMRQVFCRIEPASDAPARAEETALSTREVHSGPADMPPSNLRRGPGTPGTATTPDVDTEPLPPAA